jgi:hypothetical protein
MKAITFNYTLSVNDMNKTLLVDTSKIAVTITVPKITPSGFKVTLIGVGGTESTNNITIAGESDATINDSASVAVANDRPVILINKTSDNGSNYNLVTNAGSGGGGDSGWTLQGGFATRLDSDLGVAVDSIGSLASNVDYLTIVDASVGDVTEDLTTIEVLGAKYIKQIKVTGPFDLILQSTAGFSDGSNEIIVPDSCIIFFDTILDQWQILYNNEWKTKVVDVSSAEILTMGTTPIELLPAPGIGKYYEIESILTKYTHVTTAYVTLASLAYFIGASTTFNTILDMITIEINSVNRSVDITTVGVALNQSLNLSTNSFSDPTDGDGTLQVIIKYKVNTF